ncbi:SPOR domain-containing protein [Pseudomonas sp. RIT-PI-S]|uniref:SPOR domain-containing protein n=1 Tax=Pseudomonas sp. RIT-PI-S TaxID=3035295 RepID=UPI0021DA780F|nr:SPOR domain-containing protein [Pseudomonas sp. RIT-PI-S]
MALLDNVFKQRMVGALVLIALAVVFLPMLFSRPDELREVRVNAPSAPTAPVVPEVKVEPAPVPDAPAPVEEPRPPAQVTAHAPAQAQAPSMPIAPAPTVTAPAPAQAKPVPQPAAPAQAAQPAPAQAKADPGNKLDGNGVPVSWSVQLASLSSRASADSLQKTLRSQGYNAYVRSAEGKNRVFVGPLIDRAEAERLRDVINRQQNLKGFVVRFEPERA